MGEMMTFPETWEEYEERYGFDDREQIYSNGARLIMSHWVKKWLDHLETPEGEWEVFYDEEDPQDYIWKCSVCGYIRLSDDITPSRYCPNCGAKMKGKTE